MSVQRVGCACVRCGYPLDDITEAPTCPECGLALTASDPRAPLHVVDATLPARLARAASALRLGNVLGFPAVVFALAALAAEAWVFVVEGRLPPELTTLPAVAILCVAAASSWGLWTISGWQLSAGETARQRWGRRSCRVLCVLQPLGAVAGAAVGSASILIEETSSSPLAWRIASASVLAALVGSHGVHHALGLSVASRVAQRLGLPEVRRELSKSSKVLPFVAICWLAGLPLCVATIVMDMVLICTTVLYLTALTLAVPTVLLVWHIRTAKALSRLRNEFRRGTAGHIVGT